MICFSSWQKAITWKVDDKEISSENISKITFTGDSKKSINELNKEIIIEINDGSGSGTFKCEKLKDCKELLNIILSEFFYSKTEIDETFYNQTQIDNKLSTVQELINAKQNKLNNAEEHEITIDYRIEHTKEWDDNLQSKFDNKQFKNDENLETDAKTVVGAINEVNRKSSQEGLKINNIKKTENAPIDITNDGVNVYLRPWDASFDNDKFLKNFSLYLATDSSGVEVSDTVLYTTAAINKFYVTKAYFQEYLNNKQNGTTKESYSKEEIDEKMKELKNNIYSKNQVIDLIDGEISQINIKLNWLEGLEEKLLNLENKFNDWNNKVNKRISDLKIHCKC